MGKREYKKMKKRVLTCTQRSSNFIRNQYPTRICMLLNFSHIPFLTDFTFSSKKHISNFRFLVFVSRNILLFIIEFSHASSIYWILTRVLAILTNLQISNIDYTPIVGYFETQYQQKSIMLRRSA